MTKYLYQCSKQVIIITIDINCTLLKRKCSFYLVLVHEFSFYLVLVHEFSFYLVLVHKFSLLGVYFYFVQQNLSKSDWLFIETFKLLIERTPQKGQ
jgi:hypothetical protein